MTRNFRGSLILPIGIFCMLQELIFTMVEHWLYEISINFCDVKKVVGLFEFSQFFITLHGNQSLYSNYVLPQSGI